MRQTRLDRQLRIAGWNQRALEKARIGVIGDDDLLASLYVMSASALGINDLVVVAPGLDPMLAEIAERINPLLKLTHIEGFYTHPILGKIFDGCNLIVDLSHFALANKLLLEKGYREAVPIIRGFCYEENDEQGFKVFIYTRGREWQELEQIVSPNNLPAAHFDDAVLDIIVSGIVLEETKNILMGHETSEKLIGYRRKTLGVRADQPNVLVIGSGALGIFVGLGLCYSGFQRSTFMDPDEVEVTNLNRQVLFYDAVGHRKAESLSRRLNDLFGIETQAEVAYFQRDTAITPYDVVFDCVDNFESRIVLSEACRSQGKVLISGGTSADGGQVIVHDPAENGVTPAELLGLYDIVDKRKAETPFRERLSCTYQPDPSVIMTNQITAGFMVDSYRMFLDGQEPRNIFYDSTSSERI
jgi:molybdopterin/thiamine biosynthesis adenylyltransferase